MERQFCCVLIPYKHHTVYIYVYILYKDARKVISKLDVMLEKVIERVKLIG